MIRPFPPNNEDVNNDNNNISHNQNSCEISNWSENLTQ